MEPRNVVFVNIYDWLRKKEMVSGQKDLAEKTGISENTLSNILNGKTSVSDKSLHKLNAGFGFIFNPQYLRGQSIYMLAEDAAYYAAHPEEAVIPEEEKEKPQDEIPSWADTFIDILSKQVVENEALQRQLKAELAEVRTLRAELQQAIQAFRMAQTYRVVPYSPFTPTYQQAAEPNQ